MVLNNVCCTYSTYYDRVKCIRLVSKSSFSANKCVSFQSYCDETMRFVILTVLFFLAVVAVWAVDVVSNEIISCPLYYVGVIRAWKESTFHMSFIY